MYESGSLPSQFKPHQVGPKALPLQALSRATTPASERITTSPSHILINSTGSYHFLYEYSASVEGTLINTGSYTKGIDVLSPSQGPIRLEISPIAWSGSVGFCQTQDEVPQGAVTFVYKGR